MAPNVRARGGKMGSPGDRGADDRAQYTSSSSSAGRPPSGGSGSGIPLIHKGQPAPPGRPRTPTIRVSAPANNLVRGSPSQRKSKSLDLSAERPAAEGTLAARQVLITPSSPMEGDATELMSTRESVSEHHMVGAWAEQTQVDLEQMVRTASTGAQMSPEQRAAVERLKAEMGTMASLMGLSVSSKGSTKQMAHAQQLDIIEDLERKLSSTGAAVESAGASAGAGERRMSTPSRESFAALDQLKLELSRIKSAFSEAILKGGREDVDQWYLGTIDYGADDPYDARQQYSGQILGPDMRHGLGVMRWTDGNVYMGEWAFDQAQGLGCEEFADGTVYRGNFQAGKRGGLGCCVKRGTSESYEGYWKDGVARGPGIAQGEVRGGGPTLLYAQFEDGVAAELLDGDDGSYEMLAQQCLDVSKRADQVASGGELAAALALRMVAANRDAPQGEVRGEVFEADMPYECHAYFACLEDKAGRSGKEPGAGNCRGRLESEHGWVAKSRNKAEWMRIDLGGPSWASGVVIKGCHDTDQWTTTFRVFASLDGEHFDPVCPSGGSGDEKSMVFDGNTDRDTPVSATFRIPVHTRHLRIHPETWNEWPAMRAGVLLLQGGDYHTGEARERLKYTMVPVSMQDSWRPVGDIVHAFYTSVCDQVDVAGEQSVVTEEASFVSEGDIPVPPFDRRTSEVTVHTDVSGSNFGTPRDTHEEEEEQKARAARKIQARARGVNERKRVGIMKEKGDLPGQKRKKAGFSVQLEDQADEEQERAARRIQSRARGMKGRREVAERKKRGELPGQKRVGFAGVPDGGADDDDIEAKRQAALKIQRRARGMKDRKKVSIMKERGELPGQSRRVGTPRPAPGAEDADNEEEDDDDADAKRQAALKIQRRARGMKDRKKVSIMKEKGELPGQKRDRPGTPRTWSKHTGPGEEDDEEAEARRQAALKIQRRARGMKDRKRVSIMKEKGELPGQKHRPHTPVKAGGGRRGSGVFHAGGPPIDDDEVDAEAKREAALKIQKRARGMKDRKRVSILKTEAKEKREAVIKIQARARGMKDRQEVAMRKEKGELPGQRKLQVAGGVEVEDERVAAVMKIQSRARGMNTRAEIFKRQATGDLPGQQRLEKEKLLAKAFAVDDDDGIPEDMTEEELRILRRRRQSQAEEEAAAARARKAREAREKQLREEWLERERIRVEEEEEEERARQEAARLEAEARHQAKRERQRRRLGATAASREASVSPTFSTADLNLSGPWISDTEGVAWGTTGRRPGSPRGSDPLIALPPKSTRDELPNPGARWISQSLEHLQMSPLRAKVLRADRQSEHRMKMARPQTVGKPIVPIRRANTPGSMAQSGRGSEDGSVLPSLSRPGTAVGSGKGGSRPGTSVGSRPGTSMSRMSRGGGGGQPLPTFSDRLGGAGGVTPERARAIEFCASRREALKHVGELQDRKRKALVEAQERKKAEEAQRLARAKVLEEEQRARAQKASMLSLAAHSHAHAHASALAPHSAAPESRPHTQGKGKKGSAPKKEVEEPVEEPAYLHLPLKKGGGSLTMALGLPSRGGFS